MTPATRIRSATVDATATVRPTWGRGICHPVALVAVLLTALNDHWFKYADVLPQWVTGKLSDVCGLFFFPMLLGSVYYGVCDLLRREWCCRTVVHGGVCSLVALVFTLINLSPVCNEMMARVWISKVMDPTDLFALPSVVAAHFLLERLYGR